MGMKCLGIIPARGGSKGIPLKNIKLLSGKPLIAYTIESAVNSKSLDKIIVSTDNDEIEKVARSYGIEVIKRPDVLAMDDSPTELCLIHVLDVLLKEGYNPDIIVTLEPTSPFRSPRTIQSCIKAFNDNVVDSVMGVVQNSKRMGILKGGFFNFIIPEHRNIPRRQDRQQVFEESGTIWATKNQVLRDKKKVFGEVIFPLVIPSEETLDINTIEDFNRAEYLMEKKEN